MKNIYLILFVLPLLFACASTNKTNANGEDLRKKAEAIVEERQQIIGFNDYQKTKLIEVEYMYLKEVRDAENGKSANKEKRIEKCKETRDVNLQKYLPRDEYIKYKVIDDDILNKEVPLWSN